MGAGNFNNAVEKSCDGLTSHQEGSRNTVTVVAWSNKNQDKLRWYGTFQIWPDTDKLEIILGSEEFQTQFEDHCKAGQIISGSGSGSFREILKELTEKLISNIFYDAGIRN